MSGTKDSTTKSFEVKNMNTTALAYIGDAVYETYVRERMLLSGQTNADALHKMAVRYVKADGQALALKRVFEALTERERALVKRARNRKSISKPKNADPIAYKLATALEALVGYLYLSGQKERLEEIVGAAIAAIEAEV